MPKPAQYNYNTPIGFSQKNGIPTKGGSVGSHERAEVPRQSRGSVPLLRSSGTSDGKTGEAERRRCVEIVEGFSISRSVSEIFGLLYASPEPMPFKGVLQRLQFSKASTNTGLKYLQPLEAVKRVYVATDPRTFFETVEELESVFAELSKPSCPT
ncbi:MAG: GbsR/MarR family transcriptional regulator [Opitutales bacterium]